MDAWVWRDALRGRGAADVVFRPTIRASGPVELMSQVRLRSDSGGSFFNVDGIFDQMKPRAAMSAEGLGSLPR